MMSDGDGEIGENCDCWKGVDILTLCLWDLG